MRTGFALVAAAGFAGIFFAGLFRKKASLILVGVIGVFGSMLAAADWGS